MITMTSMHFSFESELKKMKEVLRDVLSYIKDQFPYISDTDLLDLRLVYSELLANAIIHGNNGDASKKIEMTVMVDEDEVASVIRDEGAGFDYLETLGRENGMDDYFNERGRGLQLVSSLTEYIQFNNAGNEVEFHKRIIS